MFGPARTWFASSHICSYLCMPLSSSGARRCCGSLRVVPNVVNIVRDQCFSAISIFRSTPRVIAQAVPTRWPSPVRWNTLSQRGCRPVSTDHNVGDAVFEPVDAVEYTLPIVAVCCPCGRERIYRHRLTHQRNTFQQDHSFQYFQLHPLMVRPSLLPGFPAMARD